MKVKGGWKAVNAVYKKLPESTAQLFHPERYGKDHPLSMKLEALPLDRSYHAVGQDTAGEFTVRVLARTQGYDPARISGWQGDRYQVYRGKTGTTVVVWDSVWERDSQAIYLSSLLTKTLSQTRGDKVWKAIKGDVGVWTWSKDGLYTQCQCQGSRVRVIFDCPRAAKQGVLLPLK